MKNINNLTHIEEFYLSISKGIVGMDFCKKFPDPKRCEDFIRTSQSTGNPIDVFPKTKSNLFVLSGRGRYKDFLPEELFFDSLRQALQIFEDRTDLIQKCLKEDSYLLIPFLNGNKIRYVFYLFFDKGKPNFYIDKFISDDRVWTPKVYKRYIALKAEDQN